ncbi:MAG TPA: SBBP repeat-containing protein [Bryobacteraceae bacterium]
MNASVQIPLLLCLLAWAAQAGAPLTSIILGGSGQDYATSVTSDARGNIYVAGLTYSPDFPVTAGAFQTKFGGTSDAFIAKLTPEGKLVWATYLGGILDDWATGIALDNAGNVLVAGYTRSSAFPLMNPIQVSLNNLASPSNFDAFVAKLDPNGTRLVYSTFLGGARDDGADAIAIDSSGNAYVAVSSQSSAGIPGTQDAADQFGIVVTKLNPQGALVYSFVHSYGTAAAIALDAAGSAYVAGTTYAFNPTTATQTFGPPGTNQAMVFKVSADGSKKTFETALGGSVQAKAAALAVNSAGEVYVAGSTSSVDFPVVRPLQSSPGARPLWKSTDSGAAWSPLDDLPFALPRMLIVDPTSPKTLYMATGDLGVFKSVDTGATWAKAGAGIATTNIAALAIDPVHPQTLYAATAPASGSSPFVLYKTSDGANSWTQVDSTPGAVSQLYVDAQNPNIVYEVLASSLRKSTDAGATWNPVAFPAPIQSMVFDPRVSGAIYAISQPVFCGFFCQNNQPGFFYRSVDGGANWIQAPVPAQAQTLFIDPTTNPSTIYAGFLARSVDGGVTWTPANPPPGGGTNATAVAVDPNGTIYAAVSQSGIFISRDHDQTWTSTGSPLPPLKSPGIGLSVTSIVPVGASGTLLSTINQVASSGFLAKFSPDGSRIVYSTYLRGHPSREPFLTFAAEPGAISTQNWISAIALDAAGNATVAGGTRAVDFPVMTPARPANAGLADAFVATISADGGKISDSTYFGGAQDDGALAVALDAQGDVIAAGQTWSPDFPLPSPLNQPTGFGEAFVMKFAPSGPPVISAVINGASFQPGIEAGSWVTIKGVNLSNTYPGRVWRDEEVVNGVLPTSLDGVRVTIDGKPAFVYYTSPTQINVQAPSDSAVGPVDVVVTNNGIASATVKAQLQEAAPAFFMYPGTNYAVTSRWPDYALVGDPSAVPGTLAAKPGDTVVLWGTGFGPTNPPAPAGIAVSGAPPVVTMPTVTVGGVKAEVISTVLSTGFVGLYQMTIRLPDTTPSGTVAVQASFGSVSAPAAMLFVSK